MSAVRRGLLVILLELLLLLRNVSLKLRGRTCDNRPGTRQAGG